MNEIEDILNTQIDYSDREAAEKKMNACLNLIGKAARNVAECKGRLETSKARTLQMYPDLNSRQIRIKMEAFSVYEQQELELAERLWSGLNKTIDGLKSLLSIQDKEVNSWK